MTSTTIGVKVDDLLRERLKRAAAAIDRSPHWLVKQSLLLSVERIERGTLTAADLAAGGRADATALPGVDDTMIPEFVDGSNGEVATGATSIDPPAEGTRSDTPAAPVVYPPPAPFLAFAQSVRPFDPSRARIAAAYRAPEADCLPLLLSRAAQTPVAAEKIRLLAEQLVRTLRAKGQRGAVESLVHEFALSSQEGVALMCLAEALLRVPDKATRDALIRDKIRAGNWRSHLRHSPSLFVNAATWGLLVTGKLVSTSSEASLSSALTRMIARGGEPLIRKGVDLAMRMMGEQFVTGQSIAQALANARKWENQGFRYSFDMLGEAAMTTADAKRYFDEYERAIHAIGRNASGRGIYEGPGISIKLSALHPRYERAQRHRVIDELQPRLLELARLARRYDIGLNIDAEEADRLDLSLDLLEALCFDPELTAWHGIGFVVQAYQKRAIHVIDHLIELAGRSRHRLMIRLVKGAYWDSEIKRAQVDGLTGFAVFTRKVHTDVSYLACARRLLDAPQAVYAQFATHNAQTLASIHQMAGSNFYAGQYEFQCLHGMGESLYEEVVGPDKLNRPCRIYAPVGSHETLLPYLVRRLLENGANTSFVNQIGDSSIALESLIADPVAIASAIEPLGSAHPSIAAPASLFGTVRANSRGVDFSDETQLASLSASLLTSAADIWVSAPMIAGNHRGGLGSPLPIARPVTNPADHRDLVGQVTDASQDDIDAALEQARYASEIWAATPANERAACLERAADLLQARLPVLIGLIVREAGKSLPNAVGEIREAVDFLRYYASSVRRDFDSAVHRPLGPVLCISPWNFPLAIFIGQIAAALAAGNPVLAKPAEQTPLIAAEAVRLLHQAGLPAAVVQLLPGDGTVGAALVADQRVAGVLFTGSTQVARLIQAQLASRLSPAGQPIPLVAETGGQNAMIVDSSALAEQVVRDVITSAFDSAGQRCSALRLLCLQNEIAESMLTMLRGALAEQRIGRTDRLSADIGPVIDEPARQAIETYVHQCFEQGRPVYRMHGGPGHEAQSDGGPSDSGQRDDGNLEHGSFVMPTLVELDNISQLGDEVFGPVLHVLRYDREHLPALITAINATGYGLTFGVHSRIDETISQLSQHSAAGNIYINRNTIGAVVGVQPFGGHHLSGTGPKAGGPLYLRRLLAECPSHTGLPSTLVSYYKGAPAGPTVVDHYVAWLRETAPAELAAEVHGWHVSASVGARIELPGPVGERNVYQLIPRGIIGCIAADETGLLRQIGAALVSGNQARLVHDPLGLATLAKLPPAVAGRVDIGLSPIGAGGTPTDQVQSDRPSQISPATRPYGVIADTILFDGDGDHLLAVAAAVAKWPGPVVPIHARHHQGPAYPLEFLLSEKVVTANTAAAGGNASLMMIG